MIPDNSQPEPTPNPIRLCGYVINGRGTASRTKVTESPISDFLGHLQAPGSLNVALEKPVRLDPKQVALPKNGRVYYWPRKSMGVAV